MTRRLLLPLLLLGSCGPQGAGQAPPLVPSAPADAAAARPTPEPPAGIRLPAGARPLAYELELELDPKGKTVTGHGVIEVELDHASDLLWLNGEALEVGAATLEPTGGDPIELEVVPVPPSWLAFRPRDPARTLPAGRARLRLAWSARVREQDTLGLFSQEVEGAWYATTQLEATGARRLLPCFDEPAFKTPWQLSLRVPAGLVAASTTPVAAHEQHQDGWQTLRFEPTPPLPSYLLAFTVGPYDVVDAGTSRHGVPVRILAPRGRAAETAMAARDVLPLLAVLEDWFGTPYPYRKLDLVPVPRTVGFGAMENPGLVTFIEELLLVRPAEETLALRRDFTNVLAHELAHMWFGDLVTMVWWDDIWLNEAFADWMAEVTLARWQPGWGVELDAVDAARRIMAGDSLASARRVREPVHDANDIDNAFDGITYTKGRVVLHMLAAWMGDARFQQGVRAYLAAHAHGNASFADLAAAFAGAGEPDFAGVIGSFVDQAGVPLVGFTLVCEAGARPRVELTQARWVPIGTRLDTSLSWRVPVRLRWQRGKQRGVVATVLDGKTKSVELTGAPGCPELIVPNVGGLGYYVSRVEGAPGARLYTPKVLAALPATERLAVAADLQALAAAGEEELLAWLELAQQLAGAREHQLRLRAVNTLTGHEDWLPPELHDANRRMIRALFGPAARKLGFTPKQQDTLDDTLLRPRLLSVVAVEGGDEKLAAEARRLALAWLDDRSAVAPELVDTVLRIAAARADQALRDRMLAAAKAATSQGDRTRLILALAQVRDPALARQNLELTLGDELPIYDTSWFLEVQPDVQALRDQLFRFVTEHYDQLLARLPEEWHASLVSAGSDCTPEGLERTRAFFAERTPKTLGGPRTYALAIEEIEACIELRARHLPSIVTFVKRW